MLRARAFFRAQMATDARIYRAIRTLRGRAGARDFVSDIAPRAEAGIEQTLCLQAFERQAIIGKMLRLTAHRLRPSQTKPQKIFHKSRHEFGSAATDVDILDPQQKTPARRARSVPGKQRGMGMAQM